MDVCYHHGGKSPRGLASPRIKTGIYSKYLPVNMLSQYEALLTLGDGLFKLDDETSLIVVLLREQLEKIESGESAVAWERIQELYADLTQLGQKTNKSPDDIQKFNTLFTELGGVINGGAMAYGARKEATTLIERKRRLVLDQRKYWAEKHQSMTFDRVLLLLTAMAASVTQSLEKHISSTTDRTAVLTDTQTFLNRVLGE